MESLLIVARVPHFSAVIMLTGVFAFECLVSRPAFSQLGAAAASAGGLYQRLQWLAWACLALTIASGAAWLVAVAAGMSGKPVGAALLQGAVPIVLTRTRFGEDWLLRFALAVLLGFGLLGWGRRQWRVSGVIAWTMLFLAAAMLASLAWAGHGASTPGPAGDLHLATDSLHLLAAGLWLGTLPPFILFLVEVPRTGDTNWAAVVATATRRYSAMAIASVAVLLTAGVLNTWFLVGTVPALVGTEYGRLLLAKIGLFIAMLVVAAVNLLRLAPRLAANTPIVVYRTAARLRGNARIETALGFGVVAIVGVLGTLPPGLHMEPAWPFSVRLDIGELTLGPRILLAILAVAALVCAIAAVAAAAGRYRRTAVFAAGVVIGLTIGWLPLRPAIERAYPTSYSTSTQPYAAASVDRGAALYSENCTLCHGATGRCNGPAAAGLPIRPADLTEAHLFAHSPGDLFWWVSRGMDEGVMPGFDRILNPDQRWDVINFLRARAAGVLAGQIGPELATGAAPKVPELAFEAGRTQTTLGQRFENGPVLLVLFTPPAPVERLRQLAAAQSSLDAAGLQVIAVGLGASSQETGQGAGSPGIVVTVSSEVSAVLALFRAPDDGGETELMLDRSSAVRARWTSKTPGGLAPPAVLITDAERVGRITVAAPSHAGHTH
ncbi:MAG TPA: copper homeostasis membrane protein CopD [Stellaceae bacterium]|nr:copper homeostasis membrane protein CopD [Stellaceae bacterium]